MGGKALITGAGQRLGAAMALYLAARGWDVALHYASSAEGTEAVAAECRALGVQAVTLQTDLLIEAETQALLPAASKALGGPLTLLVNNASIFEYDNLHNATRAKWDRHMESNLRAPFVLIQAFAAQSRGAQEREIIGRHSPLHLDFAAVEKWPGVEVLALTHDPSNATVFAQLRDSGRHPLLPQVGGRSDHHRLNRRHFANEEVRLAHLSVSNGHVDAFPNQIHVARGRANEERNLGVRIEKIEKQVRIDSIAYRHTKEPARRVVESTDRVPSLGCVCNDAARAKQEFAPCLRQHQRPRAPMHQTNAELPLELPQSPTQRRPRHFELTRSRLNTPSRHNAGEFLKSVDAWHL